jgi:hypothetical protein
MEPYAGEWSGSGEEEREHEDDEDGHDSPFPASSIFNLQYQCGNGDQQPDYGEVERTF